MATIKSYTDLSQSKKLAEILPLESADMIWVLANPDLPMIKAIAYQDSDKNNKYYEILPAWSLSALLAVLSTYCNRLEITLRADKKYNVFAVCGDFVFRSFDECSEGYNNPIDACYYLILKLNELNLL